MADDDQLKRLEKQGEESIKLQRKFLDTGVGSKALLRELKAERAKQEEKSRKHEEALRKQLADAEAEIAKGTSISAGALKMNQEQRKEAEKGLKKLEEIKNENKRQDENSRKILGISERRFEAVKKGNQNLKDQETILKTLEDQAKELGVKVESLGGYEKEKAKFERMKRRQELRGAGPFKIIANEFKVFGKKFQDTVNLSFGPEGKLISKLTDIGSGLKTKVVGGISSAFGLLKKGLFIAALVALNAFLKSPRFAEIKDKLVPALAKGFEKVSEFLKEFKKSVERIFDAFFGEEGSLYNGINQIITELFGDGDQGLSGSLRRILNSFLGPEGSFTTGINQVMMEIFGTDYKEQTWYKALMGLKNILVMVGTGVGAIVALFTKEGFDAKLDVLKENWAAILVAAAAIGAYLLSKFGLLGKALGLGAKATVKTLGFAISKLASGLGLAATGLGLTKENLSTKVPDAKPTTAAPTAKAMTPAESFKLRQGTPTDSQPKAGKMKSLGKFISKYPRLIKAARKIPILGTALTAGTALLILAGKGSDKEKAAGLGTLLGGSLGAAGFGVIGAALGSVFPGPGTVIGGLVGSLVGAFGGEYVGRKLAGFLLNDESEEEKELALLESEGGGPTGSGGNTSGFQQAAAGTAKNITPVGDQAMAKSVRADAISAGSIDSTASVSNNYIIDAKTNNMSNMQNVNAAAHPVEDTDMMARTLSQQPV